MRIAGLKNLNVLPNYDVSNEVSAHMQHTFVFVTNSLRCNIERLFDALENQGHEINQDLLNMFCITEIGRSPREGIRLIGDEFNHIISFPDPAALRLTYLNKINGDVERIVTIRGKSFYEQSKLQRSGDFEDSLEETLSSIEGKLLDFKSRITKQPPKPYIPNAKEQKNLDAINRTLGASKTYQGLADLAGLSEQESEFAKNIVQKYNSIKQLNKNFNNSVTQHNVRNYYKNYDSSQSNGNIMMFKSIGPNDEDIGVGMFTHKHESYLMIKLRPKEGVPYAFVISKNGTVQKNLPYETVRTQSAKKRHDSVPEYYTQDELNKLNIGKCLECADEELKNFEKHISDCQKRQTNFLAIHNNDNIGSLSDKMPKINGIYNAIERLKKDIRKNHEYLTDSAEILHNNNLDIEFSRRGIRIGKITPEKYDLRVTFPSVLGQRATQILVMDGEEIKKSFYIIDDKLLKIEIKKLSDAFTHATRQRYYHSQEYIDSSGLNGYVDLITKTLRRADNIIKKENNPVI